MSCKYKNKACQSLCDVIHGYCQFETMDDTCPIYYEYIDFDKYQGSGDNDVIILGKITSAPDSIDFKSEYFNLNIGKNN